jgi:hypothetical protein
MIKISKKSQSHEYCIWNEGRVVLRPLQQSNKGGSWFEEFLFDQ